MTHAPPICLASGSFIRKKLLEAAGLRFDVDPADIDEAAVDDSDPRVRALRLAREKALVVSRRRPGRLVLGADQVFTLDGRFIPKPETSEALREKLLAMNGKAHEFHCGMALVRDGEPVFSCVEEARVTFHSLSVAEIDAYVRTGEGIGCAGGYRLEEGGVRLIRSIEGSHFTVLGLPMLRLVEALRGLGVADELFGDET